VVFSFEAVIKTQLKIGNVDLVGVALDNFCNACCSSFLDVENFIIFDAFIIILKSNYSIVNHLFKIPKRVLF
jgi:hypothetical protein